MEKGPEEACRAERRLCGAEMGLGGGEDEEESEKERGWTAPESDLKSDWLKGQ